MKKLLYAMIFCFILALTAACGSTQSSSSSTSDSSLSFSAAESLSGLEMSEVGSDDEVNADIMAFVAVGEGISTLEEIAPNTGNIQSRVGTEDELKAYTEFISSLKLSDINKLYIGVYPPSDNGKLELAENEVSYIVSGIKSMLPKALTDGKLPNPETGGKLEYYIETDKSAYKLVWYGSMLTVATKGSEQAQAFDCRELDMSSLESYILGLLEKISAE